MPHSINEDAMYITLLFLAMSAADRKILRDELFISEKCALDYGLKEDEWESLLNLSFITYFNDGEKAISDALKHLAGSLDRKSKEELVEDLLAVALVDNSYHEKEKELLGRISGVFGVTCPDADGLA
ncbi:MAG: TerB family tellurite resistance protein [Thermoplasmatota archaeon]